MLRRVGVSRVLAIDPIAARREIALTVGAHQALAPGEALGEEVDLAIEVSGAPSALDQALRCVAFGGTVVLASWYGTKPVSVQLGGPFHRRRLRIVSSQVSTIDAALQPRWTHARRMATARDLLASLDLERLISHRFPIDRAAEAYALIDAHPDQVTQVLLDYSADTARK